MKRLKKYLMVAALSFSVVGCEAEETEFVTPLYACDRMFDILACWQWASPLGGLPGDPLPVYKSAHEVWSMFRGGEQEPSACCPRGWDYCDSPSETTTTDLEACLKDLEDLATQILVCESADGDEDGLPERFPSTLPTSCVQAFYWKF